ncbi:hypothetical protein ILYODFUR_028133 [Ilyodon furcidens]|uniref:Uncharacterized protein n=1 Tax=Ilyodon furcidens TaxID=33524 RepID=A0ABV0UY91_9TELE
MDPERPETPGHITPQAEARLSPGVQTPASRIKHKILIKYIYVCGWNVTICGKVQGVNTLRPRVISIPKQRPDRAQGSRPQQAATGSELSHQSTQPRTPRTTSTPAGRVTNHRQVVWRGGNRPHSPAPGQEREPQKEAKEEATTPCQRLATPPTPHPNPGGAPA